MSSKNSNEWSKYTKVYDPIKVGSIDGTDTYPHDRAIVRAINSKYHRNDRTEGESRRTIFVGRLHVKTDEKTLKYKFRKCGEVVRCNVVRDIITGVSKCYAFIEFGSSSSAREAVRSMNRCQVDNSDILVDYECQRTMKGWKPRRLGGGFGGQRQSGQLRFGCRARPFQKPYEGVQPLSSSDLKEVFRYHKNTK